jgi:acyl CoA:acetate/3-ketoacid CoA transferase beta subunit
VEQLGLWSGGEAWDVFVPAGGGGLVSGIGVGLKAAGARVKVVGVQPKAAPYLHTFFYGGDIEKVVETPTIADGLSGAVEAGSITFGLLRDAVDAFALVSEEAIWDAIRWAERRRRSVEPSAAVALAAALKRRRGGWPCSAAERRSCCSGETATMERIDVWTMDELMCVCISRQVRDGEVVAQGLATPIVAAGYLLAWHTHAPHIYFASAIGQSICREGAPLGLARVEALWLGRALASFGFVQVAADLLPRMRPKEFFRPAQVDAAGNFNNIAFGRDYSRPRLRLPGTGGIPDVTPVSDEIYLYVPRHSRVTFVPRLVLSGLGHHPARRRRQGHIVSDLGSSTSPMADAADPYPPGSDTREGPVQDGLPSAGRTRASRDPAALG